MNTICFWSGDHRAGQEHAPSAERCKADYKRWIHERRYELSYDVLSAHADEMSQCYGASYSNPQWQDNFDRLLAYYNSEMGTRAVVFIGRHGLFHQFEQEDAKFHTK